MHDFIWATYMEVERIVPNISEEEYAKTIKVVYRGDRIYVRFRIGGCSSAVWAGRAYTHGWCAVGAKKLCGE